MHFSRLMYWEVACFNLLAVICIIVYSMLCNEFADHVKINEDLLNFTKSDKKYCFNKKYCICKFSINIFPRIKIFYFWPLDFLCPERPSAKGGSPVSNISYEKIFKKTQIIMNKNAIKYSFRLENIALFKIILNEINCSYKEIMKISLESEIYLTF